MPDPGPTTDHPDLGQWPTKYKSANKFCLAHNIRTSLGSRGIFCKPSVIKGWAISPRDYLCSSSDAPWGGFLLLSLPRPAINHYFLSGAKNFAKICQYFGMLRSFSAFLKWFCVRSMSEPWTLFANIHKNLLWCHVTTSERERGSGDIRRGGLYVKDKGATLMGTVM